MRLDEISAALRKSVSDKRQANADAAQKETDAAHAEYSKKWDKSAKAGGKLQRNKNLNKE
jgi:hypothetical protein